MSEHTVGAAPADGSQPVLLRRLWPGRVVLCVWWVLMFTATHIPMPPQPGESPVPDKLIHYLMYLVLGLLLPLWRGWTAPVSVAGGLKSLVLLGLYGGLDELLQIPVGRSAEWFDWLADLGGAATGLALHAVANRCRGSRADARPTERTA